MKQTQVLELISPIAPDLIEEADLPLPDKGRRTPRFRAAVVAACVCLALVGTGFATGHVQHIAEQIYRIVARTEESAGGPGYSVQGDVDKFPLDDFSDALLAASEARDGPGVEQLHFDTFDEVQAFLGEDIPAHWPGGGGSWNAGYTVYLFHTEIDKLWEVEVRSFSLDAQAGITINIYTEHWRGGLDTNIAGHYAVEGDTIEQLDSYQMPNGATAEIVMETWSGEHQNRHCYGHFIRRGVLYDVMVNGGLGTQEEVLSQLKGILDSFA